MSLQDDDISETMDKSSSREQKMAKVTEKEWKRIDAALPSGEGMCTTIKVQNVVLSKKEREQRQRPAQSV